MDTKKFYVSKVFWFNILGAIVLVASQFGFTGDISPEFQATVDALLPAIVLGINVLLRFVTKQPVEL